MKDQEHRDLPPRELVRDALEKALKELVDEHYIPDSLTYAGNGEPTIHPEFPGIVDDTVVLRDKYVPEAKVTVLSNASRLSDPFVFNALLKLDNNIQKLDAGNERLFELINNPVQPVNFTELTEDLARFEGRVIIQSMFLRGRYKGEVVDNTTDEAVAAWIEKLVRIKPSMVMIYPIARATPVHNLEKITIFELERIAEKVQHEGIVTQVYQ